MILRLTRVVIISAALVLLTACAPGPAPTTQSTGGSPTLTPCPSLGETALPTAATDSALCTAPQSNDKLQVTVSILPQQYFVGRIGGDRVAVNVMVAPGAEPHTYEPKPDQLRALSNSKAYFTVGMPFEQVWIERFKAAASDTQIVDTAACIERLAMAGEHADEAVKVNDQLLDPHIWLSPRLVKQQATAIYAALAEIDCAHQAAYKANLDAFLADIDRLDTDIRARLKGVQGRKFIVFHPAWGYFAHDYGLEQIPIEVGGQEPSAADMARLIDEARQDNIRVIFAQPEFSTRAAETIAKEIGGKVLLISPLDPDWLANMRKVAGAFAEVLSQ